MFVVCIGFKYTQISLGGIIEVSEGLRERERERDTKRERERERKWRRYTCKLIAPKYFTVLSDPLSQLPPLQVGTSSVVYPAASYAPMLAARGVPVAEFNLESTPVTQQLK